MAGGIINPRGSISGSIKSTANTTAQILTDGTYDHNKLYNKDAQDQHPISAITGLEIRLEELETRGRFLSSWDAVTGKPATQPSTLPYKLNSGDYFIVEKIAGTGETNKQPEAKQIPGLEGYYYTGEASTTVETRELGISDYYIFDRTGWILVPNSVKTVYFDAIKGAARDNESLKTELEAIDTAIANLQAIKANKTALETEISRATTKENELQNNISQLDLSKQAKLVAGEHILIAADGKTISATEPDEFLKSAYLEEDTLIIAANK